VPVEKVLDDSGVTRDEVSEIVLVGGSTRIPKVGSLLSKFFKREPNRSVDPDEAVAFGAAVQGGVLSGERDKKIQDLLLLDVTPLTLGIETTGGVMAPIIPRNTVIPTSKTKRYTTAEDNQVAVSNKVFEGERPMSKDNRLLGTFELSGFPAMPRGEAQIDVTFDVDANGILSVSATETTSGKAANIQIENVERLNPEEIERMVNEAQTFKEADSRALERVEARAKLEMYAHRCRNLLRDKDLRGRMEADDAEAVRTAVDEADEWADDSGERANAAAFLQRLDLLTATVMPIFERNGVAADGKGFTGVDEELGEIGDHDEL